VHPGHMVTLVSALATDPPFDTVQHRGEKQVQVAYSGSGCDTDETGPQAVRQRKREFEVQKTYVV